MATKITIQTIINKKRKEKFAVLTAYSYPIAKIIDSAGVPIILVGDSVGMVEAGLDSTLAVTMNEMIYHTKMVRRGTKNALLVSDMPFMSYQASVSDAVKNAGRFVKKAGAEAVKLEGGDLETSKRIKAIVDAGIPVMGHVGLKPQSVNTMGGYKVQGKTTDDADIIMEEAIEVEEAGAFAIVLEGIPVALAKKITDNLRIPTIGIGAGNYTDGQVLVINDLIGLNLEAKSPKFVKQYADVGHVIKDSVEKFAEEVKNKKFPKDEHSYK